MCHRHARAYALLEVTVGGAMVALVIASLMSSIADARNKNVYAGRDVVAAQLVADRLEIQTGKGFANADDAECGIENPVPGFEAAYKRTCTSTNRTQTFNGPGATTLTVNCKDLFVEVEYFQHNQNGPIANVSKKRGAHAWVCE